MELEIPTEALRGLRKGNLARQKLAVRTKANQAKWSKEQMADLDLFAEVMSQTVFALNALIMANYIEK